MSDQPDMFAQPRPRAKRKTSAPREPKYVIHERRYLEPNEDGPNGERLGR